MSKVSQANSGKKSGKIIDFVIVGEPKSGTTALADFLAQHPEICFSTPKEPHYFARDLLAESDKFHNKPVYYPARTPEEYRKLFKPAAGEHLFGEASTGYLYSKTAAKNIYQHNPDTKIIVLLREPVSFLHSLHTQYVNEAVENETDFGQALALETERRRDWSAVPKNCRVPSYLYYSERIEYAKQLKRFLDVFPAGQLLILTNEEFRDDNAGVYKKVVEFLSIDASFTPTFASVHNSKQVRLKSVSSLVQNPTLKASVRKALGERLYTRAQKNIAEKILLKSAGRAELAPDVLAKLRREARPEVEKISRLLKRDLASLWGYR